MSETRKAYKDYQPGDKFMGYEILEVDDTYKDNTLHRGIRYVFTVRKPRGKNLFHIHILWDAREQCEIVNSVIFPYWPDHWALGVK
jgi:hypothetical protein